MQRDVLLRWLHQASLVIRRLLYGPGEVDIEMAQEHLDDAVRTHLGPMADLVSRIDTQSVANLLQDPDRIFGYAQLLGLQAAVLQAQRDPDADLVRTRAEILGQIAIERAGDAAPEWQAWLEETRGP